MTHYIGRFAPSPTGPLHSGSLYTAIASYLDAKYHEGKWLIRIEDLDPPREEPGATESIIACLEQHGLHSDQPIIYQSQRNDIYQAYLDKLANLDKTFYCSCSRKDLANMGDFYTGKCRTQKHPAKKPCAIRMMADPPAPEFNDKLQGRQVAGNTPEGLCLDFVIYRKDQLFAYQLAVVVDDIEQSVNQVVRGNDILDSTFRQLYLYQALGEKHPSYLHLPVIINETGQKLSKQNHAEEIDNSFPIDNILIALKQLGQKVPPPAIQTSPGSILDWAIKHWDRNRLPKTNIPQ